MEKRDTFKKFIKYSYLINDTKSRLKTTIKMNAFKTYLTLPVMFQRADKGN